MTDHRAGASGLAGQGGPDMKHLMKPRGKGYTLRMKTPEVLVGTTNPWTEKPFGREIKLGLNTRSHAEALRLRDVRVGQVRQLEAEAQASTGQPHVGRIIDLSPENAASWREMREEAGDSEGLDHVLIDALEKASRAGKEDEAVRFAKNVFEGAVPLADALEAYLEDRSEGNPYGYDPLAIKTALDMRTAIRHLSAFLGHDDPTLSDVTADVAFRFAREYLPVTRGLKPQTTAKHRTLLRGMWAWAIVDKRLLRDKHGKPLQNPWVTEERGTPGRKTAQKAAKLKREPFTSLHVEKLLRGYPSWGSRQGDIMRLALATGCRSDEIGSLKLTQVRMDGSGFNITKGKSENALRLIPLVGNAQSLLASRVEAVTEIQHDIAEEEQRLFPEWPVGPTTRKTDAIAKWFTLYRRAKLGEETDGKLVMHSFRHLWRTTARRAGVTEDRIHDLGGWDDEKGRKSASRVYDHGLTEDLLREAQAKVWAELDDKGFLVAF